jgi:hypothetical protein
MEGVEQYFQSERIMPVIWSLIFEWLAWDDLTRLTILSGSTFLQSVVKIPSIVKNICILQKRDCDASSLLNKSSLCATFVSNMEFIVEFILILPDWINVFQYFSIPIISKEKRRSCVLRLSEYFPNLQVLSLAGKCLWKAKKLRQLFRYLPTHLLSLQLNVKLVRGPLDPNQFWPKQFPRTLQRFSIDWKIDQSRLDILSLVTRKVNANEFLAKRDKATLNVEMLEHLSIKNSLLQIKQNNTQIWTHFIALRSLTIFLSHTYGVNDMFWPPNLSSLTLSFSSIYDSVITNPILANVPNSLQSLCLRLPQTRPLKTHQIRGLPKNLTRLTIEDLTDKITFISLDKQLPLHLKTLSIAPKIYLRNDEINIGLPTDLIDLSVPVAVLECFTSTLVKFPLSLKTISICSACSIYTMKEILARPCFQSSDVRIREAMIGFIIIPILSSCRAR